jgi:hypothetical protein
MMRDRRTELEGVGVGAGKEMGKQSNEEKWE